MGALGAQGRRLDAYLIDSYNLLKYSKYISYIVPPKFPAEESNDRKFMLSVI